MCTLASKDKDNNVLDPQSANDFLVQMPFEFWLAILQSYTIVVCFKTRHTEGVQYLVIAVSGLSPEVARDCHATEEGQLFLSAGSVPAQKKRFYGGMVPSVNYVEKGISLCHHVHLNKHKHILL